MARRPPHIVICPVHLVYRILPQTASHVLVRVITDSIASHHATVAEIYFPRSEKNMLLSILLFFWFTVVVKSFCRKTQETINRPDEEGNHWILRASLCGKLWLMTSSLYEEKIADLL